MTMMKAVIGPWVEADRKPTMPSATSATASGRPASPTSRATSCPSPAPIASDGANTPRRHAAPRRQPRRHELQQRVERRQAVLAVFEQGAGRVVARAGRGAAGHQPDHAHRQPACGSEAQRKPSAPPADPVTALRADHQQPREQPARQPRGQRHRDTRPEQRPVQPRHDQRAKIALVAEYRDRHQASQHDGGDREVAVLQVAAAGELLDGEDDAAQRRVERGGHARGGAGHHQVVRVDAAGRRQPAPRMLHHARADLHRRPLAADRQPGQQARARQHHLVQRQPQ